VALSDCCTGSNGIVATSAAIELLCVDLQTAYRLHGQEVLWFLITDSTTLRREVQLRSCLSVVSSRSPVWPCEQACSCLVLS
jgi:hypothetical protein